MDITGTDMEQGYIAIAANLQEFGYPETTKQMIREIHQAMKDSKQDDDLPHGIVGRFARDQIENRPDIFDQTTVTERVRNHIEGESES